MKKFGLLALALTIGISMMTTPTLANYNAAVYQQQQPPPLEPQEAADLYGKYYAEKTDQAKKYELAKEFLEKYPNVAQYWKNGPQKFIAGYELKLVYDKCAEADKVYFAVGGQNAANLNNLLSTCDAYLAKDPTPNVPVTNRLALATGFGVLASFYKDTARSNTYAEKSLKLIESTTPPNKDWTADMWAKFRAENIARLTQYQGLYKLRQSPPDNEGAIEYLSKAAAMKDGPAAKDPNTYLLRAEATTTLYTKLNTEYNALPTPEDKTGEPGKALLNKIYPVVEKMANDYARVVALTEGKPEYKAVYDDAKSQTEAFVKFLNKTANPDDLYKAFKADISAADVHIPREESASTAPPAAPPTGKGAKAITTTAGGASGATTTTTKKTTTPVKKPN